MGNAIAAAESLGLGTVPIGGIRRNPHEVIELLNLPKYVIPISGLCVGYAADVPNQKPRFPMEAVYHQETYNHDLKDIVNQYDETIKADSSERSNGSAAHTWSERVSTFYKKPYFKDIASMLEKQGFTCKNVKN
ncbi:nitroreductase family protein [Bacillus sp. FJAT-45350]|uniref:nitroreductase family protein n=1 Tax=Bacillus sp. FJAT-45350 TaxID=2011014 RepID=UPI00211D0FD8|nr:nitroreductase family protein [Bacillus sp. FJAT-45350]